MQVATAGKWLVVAGVIAALGWVIVRMNGMRVGDEPRLISRESNAVIPPAQPKQGKSTPPILANEHSSLPAAPRSMLEWQRDLYDQQTTAQAFAAAVEAAEGGNLIALREIDDLLIRCKSILEHVRKGGDRTAYVEELRWWELIYDPCAAIASAKAFAQWSLDEGRLTSAYWRELGARFNDPLLRSFSLAENTIAYGRADAAQREVLRGHIEDDLRYVLRSGDATAWHDLGFRLSGLDVTADKAVGIALVQVACDRGYDCTNSNVHNLALRCEWRPVLDCSPATNLRELFAQSESAATNARAQSIYERLTMHLNDGNWDELEKLVPIDGKAFK